MTSPCPDLEVVELGKADRYKEITVRLTWRGVYLRSAGREMAFASAFIDKFLRFYCENKILGKQDQELLHISISNAFNVQETVAIDLLKLISLHYNDERSPFCRELKTQSGFPEYHFKVRMACKNNFKVLQ